MKDHIIKEKVRSFDLLEIKNKLSMKKLLFTNWHLMRWVRLIFSVGIAFHAITTYQYFFLFFAAFFLIQAIFDTGCGAQGCQVPKNK